jgi:hypothetical protein
MDNTPCHQQEGVDFKSHVGSRARLTLMPLVLQRPMNLTKLKHKLLSLLGTSDLHMVSERDRLCNHSARDKWEEVTQTL